MRNASAPKARGDIHQKNILAKLEDDQKKLKSDITKLISSQYTVDFDDERTLHTTISQCMTSGNKHYIGNKPGKKLQKIYQDYMRTTEKVKKTRKSLFQIETVDKKAALSITIPTNTTYDWGELGPPPSPPKLIRCNADYLGDEVMALVTTPETLEEDVPESWEDL